MTSTAYKGTNNLLLGLFSGLSRFGFSPNQW